MPLTKTERLILVNQYLILENLFPQEADSIANVRQALQDGYSLNYEDAFINISDDLSEDECRFVLDVLDMHRSLQFGYNRLSDPQKAEIDLGRIQFSGFDGNNETQLMGYCRYYCRTLGRFEELQQQDHDDFNSHMPMAPVYTRMLDVWNNIETKYELNLDQINAIIEARAHPDRRQ